MDFAYNILSKQIQENLSQQQQRQQKIPRPVNAFMLYANENRKKMARAFPLDSNKEISKRLGKSWKELNQEQKTIYYALAKKVDEEHKKKYPDYVYNPKEARIRKAMRDAGRERAMGVAPATRGGRRSQPWVLPEPDDQFMLNQSTHGMRGSSMCGSGFPLGNVLGSGQFVQTMPSYNKHLHLVSHDTPYMQANPMAQLQHQTEMWHHYHQSANPSRPAPPTDQFMVSPHNSQAMPTYHQPSLSIESLENPIPGKLKSTVENFALNERPPSTPHHRESRDTSSISPNGSTELKINTHQQSQQPPQSEQSFDIEGKSETILDNTIDGYNLSSSGSLYQDEIVLQNPFDKVETTKGSKKTSTPSSILVKPQKSLPDFNEAFGSTERGRFQSLPDPHLPPKEGFLDYVYSDELKFDDYHI